MTSYPKADPTAWTVLSVGNKEHLTTAAVFIPRYFI